MSRVMLAANSSWNLQNFRGGLIAALAREGHQIVTVSPDRTGVTLDGFEFPHRICPMERSGTNPLRDLGCLGSFFAIIAQEKPDIFFGFTIKPNIYGCTACRFLGVSAIPNVSGLGTAFLGGAAMRRGALLLYRYGFARAPLVFFQNIDDCDLFTRERAVRAEQAVVLPGSGIDLHQFRPAPLPEDLRFLMIARLLGDKGVREYVAAAQIFREKHPSAKFALLGGLDPENRSGIAREELDRWIGDGLIDYLGPTKDVRPFIAASSAVVLPSYREGLPRTLLEGAAMARPLIATDVPGCRELVRDGVSGFSCEPKSAASLVHAMERLAATSYDERVRMSEKSRKLVEQCFDQQLVFDAYLNAVRTFARRTVRSGQLQRRNGKLT